MMGGFRGLQNWQRHWLVHWLVAVMLLPAIFGVLPQPALSAAATLERDLALSVCSHAGEDQAGRQDHQAPRHDQQCVLCALGCPVCGPALRTTGADFRVVRSGSSFCWRLSETRFALIHGVLREGSPPRGPPVA